MSTRTKRPIVWLVVGIGLLGCSVAVQRHPERGAPVRITMVVESALPVHGELLAVSDDSLWLLESRAAVRAWSLASLRDVTVSRQTGVFVRTALRGAMFGVVSGAALAGACSTITEGCWAVMAGWTGVFTGAGLLAGGLSHVQVESVRVSRPTRDALARWARYPQGLPPTLPRGDSPPPLARDAPPSRTR